MPVAVEHENSTSSSFSSSGKRVENDDQSGDENLLTVSSPVSGQNATHLFHDSNPALRQPSV